MKLKCCVSIMNDEEALRRSIMENRERSETTPMDDAYNQRRLREECGWTDVRISDFYKVSPPYVAVLKKLLLLPTDIQLRVHTKQISVQAAIALADLSPEEQKAVLTPETPAAVNTDIPITLLQSSLLSQMPRSLSGPVRKRFNRARSKPVP